MVPRLAACAAAGLTGAFVAAVGNRRATAALDDDARGAARSTAASRWTRTNYAGEHVTLAEGPISVLALLAGAGVDRLLDPSGRRNLPVAVASVGAGLVGAYDDLYGTAQAKGLRGHLRALRSGQVTSGMIKVFGVGLSSAAAAALVQRARPGCPKPMCRALDGVVDTTLIAGDGQPHQSARPAAGTSGQGDHPARLGPCRLRCRACGGRCCGQSADRFGSKIHARRLLAPTRSALPWRPPPLALCRGSFRLLACAAVTALNLASERVSFTAVIERTPLLRRLDQLGRPVLVTATPANEPT